MRAASIIATLVALLVFASLRIHELEGKLHHFKRAARAYCEQERNPWE